MFTYKRDHFKVPGKIWMSEQEYFSNIKLVEQFERLLCLPFVFNHGALSPDGHPGFGMPIGGIIATEDVIIPNAVGVDIGCGMYAVRTSLKVGDINKEIIEKIISKIREEIPVGMKHYTSPQKRNVMPRDGALCNYDETPEHNMPIVWQQYDSALYQIGTLGGGNHFIELQKDIEDNIWIMLHSGSRNVGFKVAKYYNELAYNINKKYHAETYLPKNKEDSLAFFPVDSKEGKQYIKEMEYCIDFAFCNRKLMIEKIKDIIFDITRKKGCLGCSFAEEYNIAHNYASLESHFGHNVYVHRKGATLAREGTIGIIPGAQGVKSYIVEGLGNPESFMSCSHGAGRVMGREEAKRLLNLEEEKKKLDDQGIVHGIKTIKHLDEASGAYKNIYEVMENQKDLVKILVELSTIGVVKED